MYNLLSVSTWCLGGTIINSWNLILTASCFQIAVSKVYISPVHDLYEFISIHLLHYIVVINHLCLTCKTIRIHLEAEVFDPNTIIKFGCQKAFQNYWFFQWLKKRSLLLFRNISEQCSIIPYSRLIGWKNKNKLALVGLHSSKYRRPPI